MDPERQLHIRTGVFTLAVLMAIGGVVISLNREGGLFTARYTVYADFDNIEGLLPNAPVHLAGNNVGRVRTIYFRDRGARRAIRVELDLDSGIRSQVRSDSFGSIRTVGLLGDKYIEITIGSDERPVLADGNVLTTVEPIDYDQLAEKGGELLDNLIAVSASAERIVGQFEEAMGTESIASTLGMIQNVVTEIEKGDGLLHSLVYEEGGGESVGDLRASLASTRQLLHEIREGSGPLHELIYADDASATPTLTAVRDAAIRLESILRKIDEGDGSLGALLNDPTLYEDIKLLVGGARESLLLRSLINFVRPENGSD